MLNTKQLNKEGHANRRMANTEQVAVYTGLSRSTLNKMRLTARGPPFVKIGTRVLYDLDDIDKWLDQQKYLSTSEYEQAGAA